MNQKEEFLISKVPSINLDNNLLQRFNYADNRMPISMTMNSETYYLHYDQAGTLRVVTDINHNIIKEITYDTFGNILHDTNENFKVPFGFAGGLADRDTNLVHFGYREYDPYTGKWTAKDPIDFAGGDSNLYGYVLGDPVDLVDPEGEDGVGVGGGVHLVLVGVNAHSSFNGSSTSITICGRFGPGLFAGFGTEVTTDIPTEDVNCPDSKHSASVGFGGDIGIGNPKLGASVSTGVNGSSASVSGGLGVSVGFSIGVEACYTYSF